MAGGNIKYAFPFQPVFHSILRVLSAVLDRDEFHRFVHHADVGVAAFHANLGWEPGKLAGCFLGPGEWGPVFKQSPASESEDIQY